MPTEQGITHDFDRLLAQWPGFFNDLVKHVEDIRQYGTLKQAISEAERRLAAARAADNDFNVEMKRRHAEMNADFEAKGQAAIDVLAMREKEIAQRVIVAQNEAAELVKTGQKQKDRILAEANNAAAAVDERVKKAQAKAVELEAAIVDRQSTLTGLENAVRERQAELDKIEAARAALIAKIAS